jgi:hypothetical protein
LESTGKFYIKYQPLNDNYRLRLYKNGEWFPIVVDDYIPCYYKGPPMFMKGNKNELWVHLLEKAYSKFFGKPSEPLNDVL